MKNILILISIVSLFISCSPKISKFDKKILGKIDFDPSTMEIDSSLLNEPKFIHRFNPIISGSLLIGMNTSRSFGYNPDLKLFVSAADDSARDYNFVVSTKEINEVDEVILTQAEKISSDVSKFKLKADQVFGKMIIVRGEKKADKSQKIEVSTYFPEKIELLGHPELTLENHLFPISQSNGYNLKWNKDENYANQAVKILIEQFRDSETAEGSKVERTYFTIFTRDKGEYFIKPERLALFPKGNLMISIERGDLDALNVKGLDQHVNIFTSSCYQIGAILE